MTKTEAKHPIIRKKPKSKLDYMFYASEIVKDFCNGRYPNEERVTNMDRNTAHIIRLGSILLDFKACIWEFTTCRYILKDMCRENRDLYGMYANSQKIINSLSDQKNFIKWLDDSLDKYPIPDKELDRAISHEEKTYKERLRHLRANIMPEFVDMCGLSEYTEWLKTNGSSFDRDIISFYKSEKAQAVNINDYEKKYQAFDEKARLYMEHVAETMIENGLEMQYRSERIRKYAEFRQKQRDAARLEKERKTEEVIRPLLEQSMSNIVGIIQGSLDSGHNSNQDIFGRFTMEKAALRLMDYPDRKAWLVCYVRRTTKVGYGFIRKDGEVKKCSVTNAKWFDTKEEAEKAAEKLRKDNPKWLVEAFEISVPATAKEILEHCHLYEKRNEWSGEDHDFTVQNVEKLANYMEEVFVDAIKTGKTKDPEVISEWSLKKIYEKYDGCDIAVIAIAYSFPHVEILSAEELVVKDNGSIHMNLINGYEAMDHLTKTRYVKRNKHYYDDDFDVDFRAGAVANSTIFVLSGDTKWKQYGNKDLKDTEKAVAKMCEEKTKQGAYKRDNPFVYYTYKVIKARVKKPVKKARLQKSFCKAEK